MSYAAQEMSKRTAARSREWDAVLHLPLSDELALLLRVRRLGPLSRGETAALRSHLAAALDTAIGAPKRVAA